MSPWDDISRDIAATIGTSCKIDRRAAIGGGCINSVYRIDTGGEPYFVKINSPDKAEMFAAEAAGLKEIARAGAVRVPQPICHGANRSASWLVLEYVGLVRASKTGMHRLGRELAAMHRATGSAFGWQRNNMIGSTPQINTRCDDWIEFWRNHRLGYQLRLAAHNGYRGRLRSAGEKLREKIPAFFGSYRPQPALLHGDLWSGNVGFDTVGRPVIFDPAVYYGDREADLAMTELFGGFSADFYAAYREAFPLDMEYVQRKTFYNLYHVLNHLNLFGGSYLAQAERMIEELLAAG